MASAAPSPEYRSPVYGSSMSIGRPTTETILTIVTIVTIVAIRTIPTIPRITTPLRV